MFSSMSVLRLSVFSEYIHTYCKLMIRKRMHAACMSVFRLSEEKKSLKSLSFLNDAHTETMGRRSD